MVQQLITPDAGADHAGSLAWFTSIFQAVSSFQSGATAPAGPVAGMVWLDTSASPWVLRQRNAANNDWGDLALNFATETDALAGTGNGVMTAALTKSAVSSQVGRHEAEVFTLSGTYDLPSDLSDNAILLIEIVGAGGYGGNDGGGGGGSYISTMVWAGDLPGGTAAITIGAGGYSGSTTAAQSTRFGTHFIVPGSINGSQSAGTGGSSRSIWDCTVNWPGRILSFDFERGGEGGGYNERGGDSVKGGGGGGGDDKSGGSGFSILSGNGAGQGGAGNVPGGGGGARGNGARGEVRVTII